MKDLKRFTWTVALIALLIVPILAHSQESSIRIIVETAKVRLDPDPDSKIITSVPMGAILKVTLKKGEWYLAELPRNEQGITVTGYLHISDVELLSDAPTQKDVAPPPPQQRQAPPPPPPPGTYGTAAKKGGFKIMGGLSMANVAFEDDGDVTDKPTYKMGFIAGVGYEHGFSPNLFVEVDALYHQKGFKFEDKGTDYETKLVLKTDVLSVPILVKYKFSEGTSPYVAGGFEGSFVLSSNVDLTETILMDGEVVSEEKTSEDVKEFTKSTDFGLVFGGGLEFSMGKTNLVIDGRYYMGLSNSLDTGDEGEDASDAWIKSRAFVVMLGLRF